jgi:hypothetical protein
MRLFFPLRKALFGACVAAALTFGTTAAAAGPGAPPCNSPLAKGSCRSLSDCQSLCRSLGYVPSASACRDRCCYCNAI